MTVSRLFLIDAHALCYRSYYAIKGLATSHGRPTNAVFGFINTLKKIFRTFGPEYIAVCFDMPGKTRRQEKYAKYKIQRPEMPEGLISQIPVIKDVVNAYRMKAFQCEGFEADDLIATLVRQVASPGVEIVIVSDDKDMYQLIDESVKIFSIREDRILGREELKEKLGMEPRRITDFIALAGDSTDNIPGIPGVGKVSAMKLINDFGGLDNIMNHLSDIQPESLRKRLEAGNEMGAVSRDLALLEQNVPVEVRLEDLKIIEPDHRKLVDLFTELEFNRFAAEAGGCLEDGKTSAMIREIQGADVERLAGEIKTAKVFAYFAELDISPEESLLGGGLYITAGGETCRISVPDARLLQPLFDDAGIVKITFDMKAHFRWFSRYGLKFSGVDHFDALLAAYLINPARSAQTLDNLVWQYLQKTIPAESRSAQAASCLLELYEPLKRELEEKGSSSLFYDIEIPLAHVLFRMEAEGVQIDLAVLKKLSLECDEKIERILKDLYEISGESFNVNSPKQLSRILFEKLKLPVIKKTKTGYSTDETVLTQLAARHPLPAQILDYRQLAKLKSTYIDALPRLVDPATGKLHAVFDQTGTETGRLSSHDPNLQNIPIRTELGREIRKAFVPSKKENMIISADYSQIELRILAHLSKDEHLIRAFQEGQDIHDFTAALVFDIDEKDVTPQMRNTAKRVNFGIIYGMSAFGLAKDLGISNMEAQDFIDRYFARYPKVRQFLDGQIQECERNGYVTTLLNRRRYIPEINSPDKNVRQFAQRQAINTPVQGSAADLIRLAMIRIQSALDAGHLESKMIITVHDELVFDAVCDEEQELTTIVRKHMEGALILDVPVRVSVKKGKNWLELEGI